ncbi:MAG: sigma-70 family RNA polymerase sigma factor [Bacteroidota bacterium]
MREQQLEHLFRHQHGKMVSILTRIFGLSNLETIEDAVQDTFIQAMLAWRKKMPENPEAWLTKAAKNRMIDLFRKLNAEQKRVPKIESGPATIALQELFLDEEIADSQLRMIFTACHPVLKPKDQIAFALKTVSGFSSKEIASALLLKEETIKKSLVRARKAIAARNIAFQIPQGHDLPERLNRVLEVLYLIFNEGFHSNKKELLIRKDLCGEAMRLCKMLLQNTFTRTPKTYALFALMCFHSARMESKIGPASEIIDLKNQDRSKWYFPLVELGDSAMFKATETDEFSTYHYEAAIAAEHLSAKSFADTNWDKILYWYEQLYALQPSAFNLLNQAMVQLQRQDNAAALALLKQVSPTNLEQRAYLYHGAFAEYYVAIGQRKKAEESLDTALGLVRNEAEKAYLLKKRVQI